MNADLNLLGEGITLQAVPRLIEKHRLMTILPDERSIYGSSMQEYCALIDRYNVVLRRLFEEFGVSWKEVYANSDVGKERLELAKEMYLDPNDNMLDVGCGRGFFTLAAADHVKSVVGLDLMDGLGRIGWWKRFKATLNEFQLRDRVVGVRGTVSSMPFKNGVFSVVASVHALRNFLDTETVLNAFKEMKRVAKKSGRVFIVETLPEPKTKAQEAHLMTFECKVKYTRGDRPYPKKRELTNLLEKAGFSRYNIRTFDFNLSAAPPFFLLRPSNLPEQLRAEAEREYNEAVEAVSKWGEASPPALLVEAFVE